MKASPAWTGQIVPEASDEDWNFSGYYPAYMYLLTGLMAGLGQPGAVYGQDNGSFFPDGILPGAWLPAITVDYLGGLSQPITTDPMPPQAIPVGTLIGDRGGFYTPIADRPAPTPWSSTDADWVALPASTDPTFDAKAAAWIGARSAHYGTLLPGSDPAHWTLVHDSSLAQYRMNKTDVDTFAGWLRDELGEAAWYWNGDSEVPGGRVETVVNLQAYDFTADTLDTFMTWGPHPHHVVTAPYSYPIGDYNIAGVPYGCTTAMKTAAPGSARVAAFQQAFMAQADFAIQTHIANDRILRSYCAGKGITNLPRMGIYECSPDMGFYNWPGQATDVDLYNDIITMLDGTGFVDIYNYYFSSLADEVGGIVCVFTLFNLWTTVIAAPTAGYSSQWGLIQRYNDERPPRWQAVRDVMVAHGGVPTIIPDTPIGDFQRRRLAPMLRRIYR